MRSYSDALSELPNIASAFERSEKLIREFDSLNRDYAGSQTFLVVNGSVARRELVESSDFDAYEVCVNPSEGHECSLWREAQIVSKLGKPGSTGVFGGNEAISYNEMLVNIGGQNDDNDKITQRMLLLLESVGIGDLAKYDCLIDEMIDRYVSDNITDHQLGLFLLNDIIRYYRTVCVDFEYKTLENNKPWGIRNIKLIFSRKLIYFSGLLICAEMAQRTYVEKRDICKKMIRLTPIGRLFHVFGDLAIPPLRYYHRFLNDIGNEEIRSFLKNEDREVLRKSEKFRSIKNDGHHFSWSLRNIFNNHYDSTHPIHKAIMF